MMESMSNNFSKAMSDMRKEMQDSLKASTKASDDRLRLIVDDILEVTTTTQNRPAATTVPAPVTPAAAPSTTPTVDPDEAIKLGTYASRRKMEQSEAEKRELAAQLEEMKRDNRAIKIESVINSAMAKLQWADAAVSDLISSQMIGKAEIDADGQVKIGGADPAKFISNYWEQARWAQPAPVNAGSGNSGGATRRNDGSLDLSTYNPAMEKADGENLKRLIEQAKRMTGMA